MSEKNSTPPAFIYYLIAIVAIVAIVALAMTRHGDWCKEKGNHAKYMDDEAPEASTLENTDDSSTEKCYGETCAQEENVVGEAAGGAYGD